MFLFDADVVDTIGRAKAADDGKVAFPELLNQYIREGRLHAEKLDQSVRWFDTGTPERLYLAGGAVREYQQSSGVCTGSVEKASIDAGLIGADQLLTLAVELKPTAYGRYLEEYALNPER